MVGIALAAVRESTGPAPAGRPPVGWGSASSGVDGPRVGNARADDPLSAPGCQEALQRLDAVPEPRTPSQGAIVRARLRDAFASYRAACCS